MVFPGTHGSILMLPQFTARNNTRGSFSQMYVYISNEIFVIRIKSLRELIQVKTTDKCTGAT